MDAEVDALVDGLAEALVLGDTDADVDALTLGLAEALTLGDADADALADGDSAIVNVPYRNAGYGPRPSGFCT